MDGTKRQKGADRAVARVTKASFVKSMLYAVSDSLAGDSEYGSNPANRIRRHVETIASTVDRNKDDTKEGRAVLDARFALGFDDGQYLAQAVSLLWAGDGGERLRMVPSEMMPTIMKHASAVGLVKAMDSVIDHKNKKNNNHIKETLNLVAFLLDMKEIRVSVVTYMKSFDLDMIKKAAESIEREYTASSARGRAEIASLVTSTEPEKFEIIQSMFEGLIILLDPTSFPARIFSRLLTGVAGVVHKTAKETALVFEMARLFGEINDATFPSIQQVLESRNYEAYKVADMCPMYDQNGASYIDPTQPEQHVELVLLKVAVVESFDRMAAHNKSADTNDDTNVTSRSFVTGSEPKEWKLQRIVSPMWNQKDSDVDFGGQLVDGWYSYIPTDTDVPPLGNVVEGIENLLSQSPTSTHTVETGPLRSNRLSSDTLFVDFAMIRGLCGYRGPHQENLGDDLPYSFPKSGIKGYEKQQYFAIDDVNLDKNDYASIHARQSLIYSKPNSVFLNTDFVGHVIKDDRRAPRDNYDQSEYGAEPAKPIRWAPIHKNMSRKGDEIVYDEAAHSICASSTIEFMIGSLTQHAETEMANDNASKANVLYAAAAVAKLNQLSSLIFARSSRMSRTTNMILNPQDAQSAQYITRPGHQCGSCIDNDDNVLIEKLHLPVDTGIARFVTDEASPPALKIAQGDSPTDEDGYDSCIPFRDRSILNAEANLWMRNSIMSGFKYNGQNFPSTDTRKMWGLEIGVDAQHEPVDTTGHSSGGTARDLIATQLMDSDFSMHSLFNAIKQGFNAVREIEQLQHEAAYVQKIQSEGTAENVTILGLGQTIESATRERRTAVWSDALREVAISTDRLYRFVTLLTGSIGEAADSAISWEDEDMKASQKEATQRQKALAERVSRFQTKLVESVVSSTLKASKLQLDMRSESGVADKLVVMSSEVKDNVRQITSGEAGHGFFETSVELGNVLGASSKPMAVGELVRQLQSVSEAFHEQVSSEMASSGPASYARIVEPRNSYMLHMKPDTIAAIQKSFDHITTELKHCYGYHRHIHLWEYIEGKDQTLVSRFAELVGLMLQNTRMRSGSFAAYVGQSQLIASGHNIKMQIQRLRLQACEYLREQPSQPLFLTKNGRTTYFRGSLAPAGSVEKSAVEKRQERKRAQSSFGGDEGDDRFDDASFKPKFQYKPEIERRMRQYSRARREQLSSSLLKGISIEGPTTRSYANVGASIARFSDISPTGISPITGDSYGNTAATAMHMLSSMCTTMEGVEATLHVVGKMAYQQAANNARLVGTDVCSAQSMQKAGENSLYTLVCNALQKQKPALKTTTTNAGTPIYETPTTTIPVQFPYNTTGEVLAYKLVLNLDSHPTMQNGRPVNRALVAEVNKILNDLMNFRNNEKPTLSGIYPIYYWQPHPKWKTAGQGPWNNIWVRAYSFQDKRWSQLIQETSNTCSAVRRSLRASPRTTGMLALSVATAAAAKLAPETTGNALSKMGDTVKHWMLEPSTAPSTKGVTPVVGATLRPEVKGGSIPAFAGNETTGFEGAEDLTTPNNTDSGSRFVLSPSIVQAAGREMSSLTEELKNAIAILASLREEKSKRPTAYTGTSTSTGIDELVVEAEENVKLLNSTLQIFKEGVAQIERGENPTSKLVTEMILSRVELDGKLKVNDMLENFQKWALESGWDSMKDAGILKLIEMSIRFQYSTSTPDERAPMEISTVMENAKMLWSSWFETPFTATTLVLNKKQLQDEIAKLEEYFDQPRFSSVTGYVKNKMYRVLTGTGESEEDTRNIAMLTNLYTQLNEWVENEYLAVAEGPIGVVWKKVLSFMTNGESDAAQLWVTMANAGGDLQTQFVDKFSREFFFQLSQMQIKAKTREGYLEELEAPLAQIFDKFVVEGETIEEHNQQKQDMITYVKTGQLDKYMKLVLGRFLKMKENVEWISRLVPARGDSSGESSGATADPTDAGRDPTDDPPPLTAEDDFTIGDVEEDVEEDGD